MKRFLVYEPEADRLMAAGFAPKHFDPRRGRWIFEVEDSEEETVRDLIFAKGNH